MDISKALIIDDSPDDACLYERLLQKVGPVSIAHYASAEEALGALSKENHPFDIMLLDYHMPGMNGMDFLRKLHQENIILDAPIIVLTGQGDESVAVNFMQLNVSDYIKKDGLTANILKKSIQKARASHRQKKREQAKQKELLLFAHTLAHDLKNPIGRIRSYAMLAQKKPQKSEAYINYITEDAAFLVEFIDKLLVYAESGRSFEDREPVDLMEIIKKSVALLEMPIQEKKAMIHLPTSFPPIYGSKVALVQLFQNILSNALKYCLVTPEVFVEALMEKNTVTLSIRDNGIGIPKSVSKKIFDPFYRVPNKSEAEGTGLGLAIVKAIVDQHGGQIDVMRPKKGGSQFNITLPLLIH